MKRSIRKLKNFVSEKFRLELPVKLSYHGWHHTLDVYKVCNQYIRRLHLSNEQAFLLRTASLLHDLGFLWTNSGHEEASAQFARKELPKWDYNAAEIKIIEQLIHSTQIPQKPATLLEQILCDADLDYLGRGDVISESQKLYEEFLSNHIVQDEESWDRLQLRFLTEHKYHTNYAIKFREPNKQLYVQKIIKKWGWTLSIFGLGLIPCSVHHFFFIYGT